jgi:threonine dehydrogenase-like Zn-dependent dehydrogenase
MLPFPTQPGQVGGHEGVGKIVKLGAGAESSGLKVGDRVGIKWVSSACGNCRKQLLLFSSDMPCLLTNSPRALPGGL